MSKEEMGIESGKLLLSTHHVVYVHLFLGGSIPPINAYVDHRPKPVSVSREKNES